MSLSLTYRIIQLEVLSPSSEMSLSRIKRGFLSSTSSVLCTPICIVHTYKCTDINTDNNTLWDICYQFEPLFENFQILESVTSKYLPNGTKNILKKHLTKTVSAAANLLFLNATDRASYDAHLYKCDKCYPKLAPKMSG